MKHIVTFSFVSLFFLAANGQNLVPNPSFEEYTECPEGYPDLDGNLNDWMSFRGSPDYFHNCSSLNGYQNNWGFQQPHSGAAYAGVITYSATGAMPPLSREHLGIELLEQLSVGVKYHLSFYVSTAWDPVNMNIASNNIGGLFTTYEYSDPFSTEALTNHCIVWEESIISDTVNWVKVSGSFISDSAYNYLVIGNFFNDTNTDTVNLPTDLVINQTSFYYIDDVCLSTDSLFCQNWTNVNEVRNQDGFAVYPNPSSDYIKITSKDQGVRKVRIYNAVGRLVYQESPVGKEITIDVRGFSKGLHLLTIDFQTFSKTNRIFIN
jgi:hypothetical protein